MNFTIYSKDGCPYCSQIEKVIKLSKFQYEVKKLNVDFNREEFYSKFGDGSTFPQVILDGKRLGGCAETVKYLSENKLV